MGRESLQIIKNSIEKNIKKMQKCFSENRSNELQKFDEQIILALNSLKILTEQIDICIEFDDESSTTLDAFLYVMLISRVVDFRLNFHNELNLLSSLGYLDKWQQDVDELIAAAKAPNSEFLSEDEIQW